MCTEMLFNAAKVLVQAVTFSTHISSSKTEIVNHVTVIFYMYYY